MDVVVVAVRTRRQRDKLSVGLVVVDSLEGNVILINNVCYEQQSLLTFHSLKIDCLTWSTNARCGF